MVDVSRLIDFENGDMAPDDALALFAELVQDGSAWTLQGSYGRTASALIGEGYLDDAGNILRRFDDE